MRWFVVFLLLANLFLYLWVAYGESPRPALDLPPPDIGRLPLLHEAEPAAQDEPAAPGFSAISMPPDEVSMPGLETGAAGGETAEITTDQRIREDALPLPLGRATAVGADETAPAVAEVVEPTDPAGEAAVLTPSPLDPVVDETADGSEAEMPADANRPDEQRAAIAEAVVANAPAAQPQETAGVSPDPAGSGDAADAAQEPGPVVAAADEASADRCVRIGPLTVDEAQRLRAELAAASVVDEERREIPVVDGYYVLIPPLDSRQEGNETLDRLSAAGVKDTWLFRSGELRNAISLGYFKRETSALRHVENVRGLGFDAEVREKQVPAERLWLVIARPPTTDAAAVTDRAPPGASFETIGCPAD